jgi:hypothetical protein
LNDGIHGNFLNMPLSIRITIGSMAELVTLSEQGTSQHRRLLQDGRLIFGLEGTLPL